MPMKRLALIAAALLAAAPVDASTWVTISDCSDSNTCLTVNGEKIRLACITSPTEDAATLEEQAKGIAAWNYLRGRVTNQRIGIRRIAIEKGVRTRAELYQLVDGKVTQINKDLFEAGYATIDPETKEECFWSKDIDSPIEKP